MEIIWAGVLLLSWWGVKRSWETAFVYVGVSRALARSKQSLRLS